MMLTSSTTSSGSCKQNEKSESFHDVYPRTAAGHTLKKYTQYSGQRSYGAGPPLTFQSGEAMPPPQFECVSNQF